MRKFNTLTKRVPGLNLIIKEDIKMHRKYKVHDAPFKNHVQEYTLYGNQVYVASSIDRSYHSLQQNLAVLEQIQPKCVLLDTLSNRVLKQWINNDQKESQEEQLIGKKKYTTLFVDYFPKQRDYYTVNDNNTYVYLARNRHIEFKDQLSIAYYACNEPKMFIIISKPDEILQIEDLVCNFTLQELKDCFNNTIEQMRIGLLHENAAPSDDIQDMLFIFRNMMMKQHTYLFDNYINYQAALLQKSSRVVDKSCLFTSQFFSEQVVKVSKEKLYDYTSIYQNQEISNQSKNEILEKIVIAGYIIDYIFRIKALEGQNPFENTIFQHFLSKKDVPQFMKLHEYYADQLYNLQNFIIQTSLFKAQNQNSYLTFTETIQKFKKISETYNYQFDIMQVTQIKQGLVLQQLFQKTVNKIIETRILQGINQKDVINAMQNIQTDHYTQKDMKLYLKLLLEANAMLGYPFKFPASLKEGLLPYIHNLQVEKAAQITKDSEVNFQPLSEKFQYAKLPQKESNSGEFTDEEDDNSLRYVVTSSGNKEKMPPELKNMSMEEIQQIADDFQQIKLKMDNQGNYEVDESAPQSILKQEEIDLILENLKNDSNSENDDEVKVIQQERLGRRTKKYKR